MKRTIFISTTPVCCGLTYSASSKSSFNCGSEVAADSGPIIHEDFASISAEADGIREIGLAGAILGLRLVQLEKSPEYVETTRYPVP
jgi:hypothetical protein